jgi:hypothetical protein
MNWAWWDGKMTLHHCQDEHGLDTTISGKPSDEGDAAIEPESEPAVSGTPHGH